MQRTARRNSAIVLTLLLTVLSATAFYFHQKLSALTIPASSFMARCGTWPMVWLLTGASVASLACFAGAIPLFYQNYKRGRGHSLNGITYSYAFERVFFGLAFAVPFINLRNSPCWAAPLLYSFVVGAVVIVTLHTWRRTPDLITVKDFQITGVIHIDRIVKKVDRNEPVTKQENQEFREWAEQKLARLNLTAENLDIEGT